MNGESGERFLGPRMPGINLSARDQYALSSQGLTKDYRMTGERQSWDTIAHSDSIKGTLPPWIMGPPMRPPPGHKAIIGVDGTTIGFEALPLRVLPYEEDLREEVRLFDGQEDGRTVTGGTESKSATAAIAETIARRAAAAKVRPADGQPSVQSGAVPLILLALAALL